MDNNGNYYRNIKGSSSYFMSGGLLNIESLELMMINATMDELILITTMNI